MDDVTSLSLFEKTGVAKSVFRLGRGPPDPDFFAARVRIG